MRYQYYYCLEYSVELEEYLTENSIKFRRSRAVHELIIFSIWTNKINDSPFLEEINKKFVKYGPLLFVEYSSADLKAAKLLVMKPCQQKIDITNSLEAYEYSCIHKDLFGDLVAHHKEQVGLFAIAKEPRINTQTAFWTVDTGFGEIFADRRIYELVKSHNLTGIQFNNVILPNGEYSSNLYQMTSPYLLTKDKIAMGHGEKKLICDMCGKEQFYIDRLYQLHLDLSALHPHSDFYVTERMFHEGVAEPMYIISQRFYQLLKKNKLIRNIDFIPVVDISENKI